MASRREESIKNVENAPYGSHLRFRSRPFAFTQFNNTQLDFNSILPDWYVILKKYTKADNSLLNISIRERKIYCDVRLFFYFIFCYWGLWKP